MVPAKKWISYSFVHEYMQFHFADTDFCRNPFNRSFKTPDFESRLSGFSKESYEQRLLRARKLLYEGRRESYDFRNQYFGDRNLALDYLFKAKKQVLLLLNEKEEAELYDDLGWICYETGALALVLGNEQMAMDCFMEELEYRKEQARLDESDYAGFMLAYSFQKAGALAFYYQDNADSYFSQGLAALEKAMKKTRPENFENFFDLFIQLEWMLEASAVQEDDQFLSENLTVYWKGLIWIWQRDALEEFKPEWIYQAGIKLIEADLKLAELFLQKNKAYALYFSLHALEIGFQLLYTSQSHPFGEKMLQAFNQVFALSSELSFKDLAIEFYQIARKLSLTPLQALIYHSLPQSLQQKDLIDLIHENLIEGMAGFQWDRNDQESPDLALYFIRAYAISRLARLFVLLQEHPQAKEAAQKSRKLLNRLFRFSKDSKSNPYCLKLLSEIETVLGLCFSRLYDTEQALTCYTRAEKALARMDWNGFRQKRAWLYFQLASLYKKRNESFKQAEMEKIVKSLMTKPSKDSSALEPDLPDQDLPF